MRVVALLLAIWLSHPASAATPEVITVDWSGLRQQFAGKRYEGARFHIRTTDGSNIRADLVRIDDEVLVVKVNHATEQWADHREAKIPRAVVASVRSTRKRGHRGLIGGLVGAAGGFGAGAAAVSGNDEVTLGGMGILLGVTAAGAIAGFFVGHAADRPDPEYRIRQ